MKTKDLKLEKGVYVAPECSVIKVQTEYALCTGSTQDEATSTDIDDFVEYGDEIESNAW